MFRKAQTTKMYIALIFFIGNIAAQTQVNLTSNIPYLMGRWSVKRRFVEMSGNQGEISPCQGPFPYTYSDLYEVYQRPNSKFIVLCRLGDDCASWPVNIELQQVKRNVLKDSCVFKVHDVVSGTSSGISGFVRQKFKAAAQGNLDSTEDFFKKYYYRHDKLGEFLLPGTWTRFFPPTPDMGAPPIFGRICDQYDWPDIPAVGTGYGNAFYNGALRHENVTWVFIRDITQCPCYPQCAVCVIPTPLASPEFQIIDAQCLSSSFQVSETQCDYKLVGVGGGPMVFPPATTGVPADPITGYPTICYVYSSVSGTRVLGPSEIEVPAGIIMQP